MEWAVAEGKVFIVQSRPITTLKGAAAVVESIPEISGLKAAPAQAAAKTERNQGQASEKKEETGGGKVPGEPTADKIVTRGLSSSPGIGKGKVVILAGPKEIDRIAKGDVLVTDMTTPDFVPAMKKAAAIVTNSGGA